MKFAAWDLIRVEDGLIVEITQYCDVFTLMNQIRALPTSTPAQSTHTGPKEGRKVWRESW